MREANIILLKTDVQGAADAQREGLEHQTRSGSSLFAAGSAVR